MMKRYRRRKVKKRFFAIAAFIAAVILYALFYIGPGKTPDIPAMKQADTAVSPGEDEKIRICLDPGHGGYDSGAASPSGVMEKDINLKVALKMGEILKKSNLEVIYTRTADEMKGDTQKEDLKIRCEGANNANADIYISLHCNYDKVSRRTQGMEVWCRFPNEKGEELAQSLQKRLAEAGGARDRGIKYEADGELYVLKNTNAVSVLVEMGFLSNAGDCAFLQSDSGQEKYAEAMAQGILDYIGQDTDMSGQLTLK